MGGPHFSWGSWGRLGPCFRKVLGLDLGMGRGGGWDLQKMQSVLGFRKDFLHLWALPVQIRKGWGPLMWPKWGYRENPLGFYRIVFSLYTQGAPMGPLWAHSGPCLGSLLVSSHYRLLPGYPQFALTCNVCSLGMCSRNVRPAWPEPTC